MSEHTIPADRRGDLDRPSIWLEAGKGFFPRPLPAVLPFTVVKPEEKTHLGVGEGDEGLEEAREAEEVALKQRWLDALGAQVLDGGPGRFLWKYHWARDLSLAGKKLREWLEGGLDVFWYEKRYRVLLSSDDPGRQLMMVVSVYEIKEEVVR